VLKLLGSPKPVVVLLSTGDMGCGAEDIDIEVWLPARDLPRDIQLLECGPSRHSA